MIKITVKPDKVLPKGETAHDCGYLIFDTEELKILFQNSDIIELKSNIKSYSERLLFFAIKKTQMNANSKSLVNSINHLKDESFNKLKNLRNSCNDITQGRSYANQTQLHINAKIALEKIKNQNNA